MPDGGARRAAILLPSLSSADATSTDALEMAAALRDEGWDARVFAGSHPADLPAHTITEAARFLEAGPATAIYHSGARWDDGLALLKRTRGPIFVRDHNVTPPRFFEGVSEEFADAARQGLAQRATLARDPRVTRFLAASPRNARELHALGATPNLVHVVPPFHRSEELLRIEPDEPALRRWQHRPAVLFVGRVAPHKGHRRLLRVAAVYRELFGMALPLRIVGAADPRLHRWTRRVDGARDALADRDSIELCGALSQAGLKAAYLAASAFLCCSEHEGFCVPLLEATAFGVPIIAAHEVGIAATLGPAGLVVEGADDVLATAVHRVLSDAALREQLVASQRGRAATMFSVTAIRAALRRALAEA